MMPKDIEILSRELAKRPEFLTFVGKLAAAQARADARHLIEATAQARNAALESAKKRRTRRGKGR
jgi:hypothetical protein